MKTTTELRIEYALLSWEYEFPPNIETALEKDYVAHPHLYNERALKGVAALLRLDPCAAPESVLQAVRSSHSDHT